jgi:hypothetical protein
MMRISRTYTENLGGTSTISVDVPYPTYGYTVQCHKAVDIQRFKNSVGVFDNGIEYDYRTCEFQVLLTDTQITALSALLRNNDAMSDTMQIDLLGRGFSLAGPDMGDTGTFTVSLVNNQSFSAMRTDYFGMFDCKLHFVFHGLPIPPPIKEPPEWGGVYDFGEVVGLRDPERAPTQEYAVTRSVFAGGNSYVKTPTDEYMSTITQRTTTKKMAELTSYLQRVRGNAVTVRMGKNHWLFGPDNSESGSVKVKLLDNTITVVHENLDTWKTTIQMWKVPEAA